MSDVSEMNDFKITKLVANIRELNKIVSDLLFLQSTFGIDQKENIKELLNKSDFILVYLYDKHFSNEIEYIDLLIKANKKYHNLRLYR